MKLNAVHTTLPVADLDRAKKFYLEKLGLSPSTEEPGGVFYEVGPTRFLVFPAGGRASGEHTQMGFTVDDIESAVAELKRVAVGWPNSALNVREPLLGSTQTVGQLRLRYPAPAALGRNPLSDRDELLHRPLSLCRSRASPYRDR